MQAFETCNIIQTCIEHVRRGKRILIKVIIAELCPLNNIHILTISYGTTVCVSATPPTVFDAGVPVYLAPWTGCPPGGKPTMVGLPPGGQPVPGYPTPHPGYLHPRGQHIPAGLSCPPGVKLNQPGYLAPHP